MNKIKTATLQGKWTGDAESNIRWYVEQALALKGKGIDLVVLPEMFHIPYFPFEENADVMFNSSTLYDLPLLKYYAEPLLENIKESSPAYEKATKLLKFLEAVKALLQFPGGDNVHCGILLKTVSPILSQPACKNNRT